MSGKISLGKIIYVILMIMFLLFPTSVNKQPYQTQIVILLWLFQSVLIFLLLWYEKMERKQIMLAIVCALYLVIATVIALGNSGLYVSLARIVPLMCFWGLCCISNKIEIERSFFVHLLDFMCIVLIIWNCLTLFRVQGFIEFVNNFYTQLDTYTATYWSLVKNKPVFTFGVHNFASIFYMHIFLFNYFTYKELNKKRFVFYMLAILIFTLLLRSSASAGIVCVMLIFLCKLFLRDKKKLVIFLTFLIAGLFVIAQMDLFIDYMSAFASKSNGFFARYSSETSLYKGNYELLKELPLGIGFSIGVPELNIYFGDSGYIIYYTMGGILLPVLLFVLIYRYYKKNLNRKMAIILTGIVILTELSLISFMYNKTLYLYVFEVGFYKSMLEHNNENIKRRKRNA